jgi:hypothetical protein
MDQGAVESKTGKKKHDEIKKQVASSLNGGELLYMQAMSCVGSHHFKYCK